MPSQDPKPSVVTPSDAAATFPQVPGYRFQKKLGQGGMATVYLAIQESLDRPVCVKVMDRDALTEETAKQRFENEARTIARLSHPNIVAIYEVGRTGDGRLYYIMPYLASGDLAQRDLRDDDRRIADVLRSLLSALGYAHARGIVHRDVKRDNVLFDSDDRPLLADFGIALSKSDEARITTAGIAVGSSGYMAPEQARGDIVDSRADLYSVGVLTYELLTGDLPYRAPDALALALMHLQAPIPRLPPAKRHWQAFVDRAMAKSPDKRFANAQQMIDELDQIVRRAHTKLSNRALDAGAGGGWKRPKVFAIVAGLLLAIGAFAARDRLAALVTGKAPAASTPAASSAPPVSPAAVPVASVVARPAAASPAAASGASPAVDSTAADSTAAASDADPNASPRDASGADSSASPASSSKHTAKHRAAPPRRRPRENAFKRWWRRL